MKALILRLAAAIVLIALVVGCSATADAPVAPTAPHEVVATATVGGESPAASAGADVVTATPPGRNSVGAAAEATAADPAAMISPTATTERSTTPVFPVAPNAPAATVIPTTPAPARRTVAIDPGHGGPEIGAASDGLAEKDLNLKIALELAARLSDEGVATVLTRDTDRSVSPDYAGGGYPGVSRDLQARVDIANAAKADLFISIHNNGSNDSTLSGTEVWYSSQRSFAADNERFATIALNSLVKRLASLGYPVVERGIKDDSNFRTFQGRVFNIYVLGPGTGSRPHVPTMMPAILGETLFLSNAADAAMLRQDRTIAAIAAGYRDAVVEYFAADR